MRDTSRFRHGKAVPGWVLVLAGLILIAGMPLKVQATTYYTIVGAGLSHRDAHDGEVHYPNGFLSPVLEAGLRTRSGDTAGFYVRFLINPDDMSQVSSYYICGRRTFYYLLDILYVGVSGGLHIESRYRDSSGSDQNATIRSEDVHALFNLAFHAGMTLEIISGSRLVLDGFAAQSLGRNMPWSVNATVGIMSYF